MIHIQSYIDNFTWPLNVCNIYCAKLYRFFFGIDWKRIDEDIFLKSFLSESVARSNNFNPFCFNVNEISFEKRIEQFLFE